MAEDGEFANEEVRNDTVRASSVSQQILITVKSNKMLLPTSKYKLRIL